MLSHNEQLDLQNKLLDALTNSIDMSLWSKIFNSNIQKLSYFYSELVTQLLKIEKLTNIKSKILLTLFNPKNELFQTVCEITAKTNLRYYFPIILLPAGVRANMNIRKMDEFYKEKLILHENQPVIQLNAFEYFFFHLASFSISPELVETTMPSSKNQNFYNFFLQILHEFINFFLPSTAANVLYDPNHYLSKLSVSWAIKTFLKIFVEFWLKQIPVYELPINIDRTENLPILDHYFSRNDIVLLTTPLLSNYLTMLVKFLHAFSNFNILFDNNKSSNIISQELSEIYTLRKELMSDYVACLLYTYLRYMIINYPNHLENHYSIWITFVKPWRYTNQLNNKKDVENIDQDLKLWSEFINKYLGFYTILLQHILNCITTFHLEFMTQFLSTFSRNFTTRNFVKKFISEALDKKIIRMENGCIKFVDYWYYNFCVQQDNQLPLFLSHQHKIQALKWLQMIADKILEMKPLLKPSYSWLFSLLNKEDNKSLNNQYDQLVKIFNIWATFFEVDTSDMLEKDGDHFFEDDESPDGRLPDYIQKMIDEGKFQYDICVQRDPEAIDDRDTSTLNRTLYQIADYINGKYGHAIRKAALEDDGQPRSGWRGTLTRYLFRPRPLTIYRRSPFTTARPGHDLRRLHPSMRRFARTHRANYRASLDFLTGYYFWSAIFALQLSTWWFAGAGFCDLVVYVFLASLAYCVFVRYVLLRPYV